VSDREVTAIVYLNEDWGSASEHGGYLRIHHPHDDGAQAYTDVAPHAGRLVLFQSRLVEHEVLPALRTRWAVSAWLPARAAFAVYDCV
jgi:SM-20-related protein